VAAITMNNRRSDGLGLGSSPRDRSKELARAEADANSRRWCYRRPRAFSGVRTSGNRHAQVTAEPSLNTVILCAGEAPGNPIVAAMAAPCMGGGLGAPPWVTTAFAVRERRSRCPR